ncbi:MAG: hypothetical protein QXO21_06565 [Candidatus Anstonellales archaeon]
MNKKVTIIIILIFIFFSKGFAYSISAPTIKNAIAGDKQVTLNFSDVSSATYYCVYYSMSSTVSKMNYINSECFLKTTAYTIMNLFVLLL